jgi:acyl-coenzyme A thioesterase PaaI-like protein
MPRVICRGDALHVGRRTATSQARVESEDGKLLAHATCTCLIGM